MCHLYSILLFCLILFKSCIPTPTSTSSTKITLYTPCTPDSIPISDGFDFPVGPPDGKGYYNAQVFGANQHLGDDWNGIGGGNTDLGDPIHTIAHGYVKEAKNHSGGWGKVIRIIHRLDSTTCIESLYAHCLEMKVQEGQFVHRGQEIATIGNADGAYYAHLHLEIRDSIHMPLGGGYSSQSEGYLDPTAFIRTHRP